MAPIPAKYTYTGYGYTYTYTYPDYSYTYHDYNTYDPFNLNPFTSSLDNLGQAIVAGWIIALAVIVGINVLVLVIVAIVYFRRQKRRQAWYGQMAAHYRNGGLPPWGHGDGSIKAPLLTNDYNSKSGFTYPPTPGSNPNPKAQYGYENPTQFGAYPPSNPQSPGPGPYATGATAYTGASYHTAHNVAPTPPPQPLSPQPQPTIGGHSQYSSSYEQPQPHASFHALPPPGAYVPAQNPYGTSPPPQNPYGTSLPPQNPYGGAQSPQSPYGSAPAYESPKGHGSAHYGDPSSGSAAYGGGAFGANEAPHKQ